MKVLLVQVTAISNYYKFGPPYRGPFTWNRMKLFALMLMIFSYSAQAELIRGRIDSVDLGQIDSPHLIMLDNGLVLFLDSSKSDLLNSILFESKRKEQTELEFEVDEEQNILSIKFSGIDIPEEVNILEKSNSYTPTTLEDQKSAYTVFEKMRKDFKEDSGQCYNMAHIWAYEEFLRSGNRSSKLFMFFTTKYIRKYRFHWWFHVAPMVYATDLNKQSRLILDRRYSTYPMATKEWSNSFVKSGRSCKEVKKFAEYYKASTIEDCYFIETSMYFWQPRDIRIRDTEAKEKRTFLRHEIRHALSEAFLPRN